ncbi:MAG: HEAT repeat domain-containing protein, partial [candidate division WOR-3 bacterium]
MPLQEILPELASPDPATRDRALNGLRRLGGAEAAGALVFLLADPEENIRIKAAEALIAIGPEAVEPVGRYIVHWEGPLGTILPEVLGRLRVAAGIDLLERHLSEPDPKVRESIARALGRMGTERATKPLLELLRDLNPAVRIAAAQGLAELADPQAVDGLMDELADDNPEVRKAAIDALGRIGDRRAAPVLTQIMIDDPRSEVRLAAQDALRRISSKMVAPLVRALSTGDPKERIQALATIVSEGKAAVVPLTGLLTHANPAVRAAAAEVLGLIGDPVAIESLAPLLTDAEGSVRLAVARALGRLRHVRSAERLAQALHDQDPKVAAAAASALEALGEIAVEPMFQLLTSQSADIRVRAIAVLGRLRHQG